MTDPIRVQPLQPEDRADWQRLWQGYLGFYSTSRSDAVFDITFERLCTPDSGEFRCLMASHGETIVGLAHFLSHRHCWHENNVIYLQDLFVDEKARGCGIGRALIGAVEDIARREHAPAVYWITHEDNHDARRLYDRMAENTGFIKYQMNIT